MNDKQGYSAPFRDVRGKCGRDLHIAESERAVIRVGDDETVFVLVGHGVPASGSDDKVIDPIAIQVADKLRAPESKEQLSPNC